MHQELTDWIIVFNYILALKLLKWNNHEDFFLLDILTVVYCI